ncbi:MAG: radical SAM protein [Vitreimonas sp.]
MTVELRPLGVRCNIRCEYCYQNPQRDVGVNQRYDIEAMKAAIEKEGGPFTLFGGEPLLLPRRDLELLWTWGLEKYGSNTVQTNGSLIKSDHIRMFKQYKVYVGVSIDGPGDLNDIRWAGSLEATRSATAKTEAAIELLCKEGLKPSLIVTLHRANADRDRLPILIEWMHRLDQMGVASVRLHILEVEDATIRRKYALTTQENIDAYLRLAEEEGHFRQLRFDLFKELSRLLMCEDKSATCVWTACDPYTTAAVRGVEGSGQRSNCGRTNKDGIDFSKSDAEGYERYVALYHTPQDYGGCAECRFFLMCKGQCPGTAIDGDWRNRTEYCDVWKALFEEFETRLVEEGKSPISLSGPKREALEHRVVEAWRRGQNPSLSGLLAEG